MSLSAVNPRVARIAGMSNLFALSLRELHEPVEGPSGSLVCAQSCRKGDNGAGDVQLWPCTTARLADQQINRVNSALLAEADRDNSDLAD